MLETFVVIAYGSGYVVTTSNTSIEVEFVFHLDNCYVIVHPSDIIVLVTVEDVVCKSSDNYNTKNNPLYFEIVKEKASEH